MRSLLGLFLVGFMGCGEQPVTYAPFADYDGDGIQNQEDCAPYNPEIAGNFDGDDYYDARCLELWEQGQPGIFLVHLPELDPGLVYLDCNDHDPDIQPGATPGDPLGPWFYENPPEDEHRVHPDAPANCASPDSRPPAWASDGRDNDCDPSFGDDGQYEVDRPDWDEDGFLSDELDGDDCHDACSAVNPGIDEAQTDRSLEGGEAGCPVYAYDGFDNDCEGGDLVDWDGDGTPGVWFPGGQYASPAEVELEPDPVPSCEGVVNLTTHCTLAQLTGTDAEGDCDFMGVAPGTDCNDLAVDVYLDAPEFCDTTDHSCDGDALDGFERGTALEPYAAEHVVYVDASSTVVVPNGQTPETGFPTVEEALAWIELCPDIRVGPGDYAERLDLDLVLAADLPEEGTGVGDTGADAGSDDTGGEDTWQSSVPWVRIAGTAEGVRLLGDDGRFLEAALGPDQVLELDLVGFDGAEDGSGGLRVEGGTLHLYDVGSQGVTKVAGVALAHEAGVATEIDGLDVAGAVQGMTITSLDVSITGARFADNGVGLDGEVAASNGGALYLGSFAAADIVDSRFVGNQADVLGGGLFAIGQALTLQGVQFVGNEAGRDGGGAYVVAESLDVAGPAEGQPGLVLADNRSGGYGAGGYLQAVTLDLDGLVTGGASTPTEGDAVGNVALTDGGALYLVLGVGSDQGEEPAAATFTGIRGAGDVALGDGGMLAVVSARPVSLSDVEVDCGSGRPGDLATWLKTRAPGTGNWPYSADRGGALALNAASVTLDGMQTWNCTAGTDGGALVVDAVESATLSGTMSFQDSAAAVDGGALYVAADVISVAASEGDSLSVTTASAGESGGGLHLDAATLSLGLEGAGNVVIVDASAGGNGGGAWIDAEESGTLSGLDLQGCQSRGSGGGLYVSGEAVSLGGGSTMDACIAEGSGGGLYTDAGSLAVDGLTISADGATVTAGEHGGGIAAQNRTLLSLDDVVVSGTASTENGGCVYVEGITEVLVGSLDRGAGAAMTLTGCTAGNNGGGLSAHNVGNLLVGVDCTVPEDGSSEDCTWGATDGADLDGNGAGNYGHQLYLKQTGAVLMDTDLHDAPAEHSHLACGSGAAGACDGVNVVQVESGVAELWEAEIVDNGMHSGSGESFGLYVSGTAYLGDVLVARNDMGGLRSNGSLIAQNVTVADNSGVGVQVADDQVLLLACSVLAGNGDDGASYYANSDLFCVVAEENEGEAFSCTDAYGLTCPPVDDGHPYLCEDGVGVDDATYEVLVTSSGDCGGCDDGAFFERNYNSTDSGTESFAPPTVTTGSGYSPRWVEKGISSISPVEEVEGADASSSEFSVVLTCNNLGAGYGVD